MRRSITRSLWVTKDYESLELNTEVVGKVYRTEMVSITTPQMDVVASCKARLVPRNTMEVLYLYDEVYQDRKKQF